MATTQQYKDILEVFNQKLEQARGNKIISNLYVSGFQSLYGYTYLQSFSPLNIESPVPDVYIHEMQQHIVALTSLQDLKDAIDISAINPRQIPEVRNSKDVDAKKMATQLIPNLKKILVSAAKAMESSRNLYMSADNAEVFTFLASSMNDVKVAIKDINKPTDEDKIKHLQKLTRDTKVIKKGKIAKWCLTNPSLTAFIAAITTTVALLSVIAGIIACCLPGGFVFGVPMIAASIGLSLAGSKLMDIAETRNPQRSRTKGHLADYAARVKKFASSDKFYDAHEKNDAALRKAAKKTAQIANEKSIPEERRAIFFRP